MRITDSEFRYTPAIEHTEPGYLQKRMEEYKQKVQSEEKEASDE